MDMLVPTVQVAPATTLIEINDRPQFVGLAGEWNELVAARNDQPFYRHEFIRSWIDNFTPTAKLRVMTLRNERGRLVAVLPLIEQRTALYGLPVRQLVSAGNDHSNRFDLVAEDDALAGRLIFRHLADDRSWDVVCIKDVVDDGGAVHLYEAARQAGFPTGTWESQRSPYIPLCKSFDELMQPISTKFKANLRRRRKRLEEQGVVSCRRVTGGHELEAVMVAGFTLEQEGWKGAAGTAIAQDPRTRGFYTDLAHATAPLGYLALYALYLNERMVAFQYGLEYQGVYSLLKVGYDESLSACSPGQLLVEEVLKDNVRRGLREFDFLGPSMAWKRDWTDRVRPHQWLFVFRKNPFGWMLGQAKFTLGPRVKKAVASWRQ